MRNGLGAPSFLTKQSFEKVGGADDPSKGSFKIRAKTGHKPRVHRGWAASEKVILLGRPGASARPLKIGAFSRDIGATFPDASIGTQMGRLFIPLIVEARSLLCHGVFVL
jgi:hypothetical protein